MAQNRKRTTTVVVCVIATITASLPGIASAASPQMSVGRSEASVACQTAIDRMTATLDANPTLNEDVVRALAEASEACGDSSGGPSPGTPHTTNAGAGDVAVYAKLPRVPHQECAATNRPRSNVPVDGSIVVVLEGQPVWGYVLHDTGNATVVWSPSTGLFEYLAQASMFGEDATNTGVGWVSVLGQRFPAKTTASGECNAAKTAICAARGTAVHEGLIHIVVTSSFDFCNPS